MEPAIPTVVRLGKSRSPASGCGYKNWHLELKTARFLAQYDRTASLRTALPLLRGGRLRAVASLGVVAAWLRIAFLSADAMSLAVDCVSPLSNP